MTSPFVSSLDLLINDYAAGHKALQEELVTMRFALKHAMDKGLAADEFLVANGLMQAVDAAGVAVDKMYTKIYN